MLATDMWNNSQLVGRRISFAFFTLCGFSSVLWALLSFPSFWLMTPVRSIVDRIVADERFKPGALDGTLARMSAHSPTTIPRPEFSHAEALLNLRAAEHAMQQKSADKSDAEVEAAEGKVKTALAMAPTDSFLWLMLYSMKTARDGFDSQYMHLLSQSYATGPLEGWVALRRNRFALASLSALDEKVQNAVIVEFAAMVDADFINEAALTLERSTSTHRNRLIASLTSVDIVSRQALARQLWRNGVKIDVPGVPSDDRPWR